MMPVVLRIILCLSLLPALAQADQSTPLFYNRAELTIERQAAPAPAPLPWLGEVRPQERSGIVFDVEVRDAASFYNQKDWFNLSGPTDDSGVLLAFAAPTLAPIIRSRQYAPLDILMVDNEGKIVQIVPNIMLADLQREILPKNPILAFLFLKGETCQRLSIAPGDRVVYDIFTTPPTVLSEPVSAPVVVQGMYPSAGQPVRNAPPAPKPLLPDRTSMPQLEQVQ
jgi:uncharacterized membrane protein (UPF0127 family)